ncbi:MAG: low molecular weight protein arginine phosphatase [Clostridia bacterium]|nr:low molecular weight protein arginine phosphatase [Clostridia bacterium]
MKLMNEPCVELSRWEEAEKRYLFVCTGNTCRSPMAEAVFNRLHGHDGLFAASCGISADGVSPVSSGAVRALEAIGIYGFEHISRPVSDRLMEKADLIIGMTASHAARLIMAFPQFATKITAMPLEIEDPYGGDDEVYRICLAEICEALGIGFDNEVQDEEM